MAIVHVGTLKVHFNANRLAPMVVETPLLANRRISFGREVSLSTYAMVALLTPQRRIKLGRGNQNPLLLAHLAKAWKPELHDAANAN